ncbi:hypothetical protein SAMN04488003_103158 [Loktanella fryxellensis]|uniref:Uncharacterized protein n=1 Tax=Loktanella fryxellensis TaxID=245187 RepID=A0A1H8AII0_9RHOB|nr:hypothetical protein [Loktanella fryxellensis]SEM69764.1 hypothetical protein SAMN04488003_103158 [Loktanella fryxellensis]
MRWGIYGIGIASVTTMIGACVPGISLVECVAIYAIVGPFSALLGAVIYTDINTVLPPDTWTTGRR